MADLDNIVKLEYQHAMQLGWLPIIKEAGQRFTVDPALICGIISRETNFNEKYLHQKGDLVLDGEGKVMRDSKGELIGHGHGPMQVDDRSHQVWCAMTGADGKPLWQDPKEAILKGTEILKETIDEVKHRITLKEATYNHIKFNIPELNETQLLRAAVAGYNCGALRALYAFCIKGQPDILTTGHDYGRDVLARTELFKALLRGTNG